VAHIRSTLRTETVGRPTVDSFQDVLSIVGTSSMSLGSFFLFAAVMGGQRLTASMGKAPGWAAAFG